MFWGVGLENHVHVQGKMYDQKIPGKKPIILI